MMYKNFLLCLFAGILATACVPLPSTTSAQTSMVERTKWKVNYSLGLDAIVFVGALSGDLMSANHYKAEVDHIRAQFSDQGRANLKRLDDILRVRAKLLVGPTLALYLSAGKTETLEDVIFSLDHPEILKPALMKRSAWDEDDWEGFLRLAPTIRAIFVELQGTDFEETWRTTILPDLKERQALFLAALSPYNIIPEQARLLGHPLDPTIEIILLHFSQPYGIRITGQRFLAHHSYSPETQLRIAAHEIFHPPFRRDNDELWQLLKPLEQDPWMQNIVTRHDPHFGYNSFEGIMDEDSTQALDQIVSERMGFDRDPGERFRESDGGMHMVAAALYQAMREDGFATNGGSYEDWLIFAIERGLLTPDEVRRRATLIVGEEAVAKWSK